MSNHLDTVYFGAAIERTPDVLALQEQICTEYGLVPRGELHLTLGFVGKLTQDQLDALARRITEESPPALSVLVPIGLGGAFETDGKPHPWNELSDRNPLTVARVLWWAIRRDLEILRLREILATAVNDLQIPYPSGTQPFSPHATLGSAGPQGSQQQDFALWDVHTLTKEPNISADLAPGALRVARLHLTSVPVQPDSLVRFR